MPDKTSTVHPIDGSVAVPTGPSTGKRFHLDGEGKSRKALKRTAGILDVSGMIGNRAVKSQQSSGQSAWTVLDGVEVSMLSTPIQIAANLLSIILANDYFSVLFEF